MNKMDNYPLGAANDPRAPYNQDENPEVEVEVTVSITLSKTVKVLVADYELVEDTDEDGTIIEKDFTDTNFLAAVEEQIVLPQDASLYADVGSNLKAAYDLSGWHVDEMECVKA